MIIQPLSHWPLKFRDLYNIDTREWCVVAQVTCGHEHVLPTRARQNNNKTRQRPSEHSMRHSWQDAQMAAPGSHTTQEARDSAQGHDGLPVRMAHSLANCTT
jgi:hypothetical protein